MKEAGPRKETTRQLAEELQRDRFHIDSSVSDRRNVLGSMIGVKMRRGEPEGQLGITVLVREKIPLKELEPKDRIPKTIKAGKKVWKSDVLVWPKMVEQNASRPFIIFDGATQGTMTCFGVNGDKYFGISCAHCLKGTDGNAATPSEIWVYAAPLRKFTNAGMSAYAVFSPGFRIKGSAGYVDCGLFDLHDSSLISRARASKPLSVVSDLRTLLNTRVVGVSALDAPGSSTQARTATIVGIDASALGEHCDLILKVDAPGTFFGDSGLLWLTPNGRAVGIHARGELMPSSTGSPLTSAMSAARAAAVLGVRMTVG